MTPLVSVVVPVFDGERYLADTLTSVVHQTYEHLEVIVVDDGSSDRSPDIARTHPDPRVRAISQGHAGAASARNTGVAVARGDVLAFIDADDLWTSDKLETQVAALGDDPGIDMVFGHYISFSGDDHVPSTGSQPGYSLGTLLVRRESWDRVGSLSTRWSVGEFLDWQARADDVGLRHLVLPTTVLMRRVHSTSLTARDPAARADYAKVARQIAARRGTATCRP